MSATLSRPVPPILAGPIPPVEPLPFITYLRTVRRNFIEALDETMYRAPIIRQRSAFSPSFIVSAPAGLRRVLLDNAANYPKAPVEHRILGRHGQRTHSQRRRHLARAPPHHGAGVRPSNQ
jgi:hypothetical protein